MAFAIRPATEKVRKLEEAPDRTDQLQWFGPEYGLCQDFRMGHEYQDRVSLELARRVAAGLPEHPEWISLARENLDRWSEINNNSPSLLRCYAEWRRLLSMPVPEIQKVLLSETGEGQRLRQNSPFAGVLSPKDVWEIKRRSREHATSPA